MGTFLLVFMRTVRIFSIFNLWLFNFINFFYYIGYFSPLDNFINSIVTKYNYTLEDLS